MIFLQFKYNHITHLLKSLQGFIIFNIKSKVPHMDSRPFLIFSEPPLSPNQCFSKCRVVLTSVRDSCVLVKKITVTAQLEQIGISGVMLRHLHFTQVLSILATFTLALERPCSRCSPIFTLFFILTTYWYFPEHTLVFFCVFVLISLFNSFLGNSSSFFETQCNVMPFGKTSLPCTTVSPPVYYQMCLWVPLGASLDCVPNSREVVFSGLVSLLLVIRMFLAFRGILTNGGVKEKYYLVTLVKEW